MLGLGCPDCLWVGDRLPLLAGGELTGADRRKAERHLIACPGCRRRRESLAGALGVLHAAGRVPVGAGADAPSLWPALARQIREARHEPRPSTLTLPDAGSWLDALSSLFRPSARSRPAFVLGAVLGLAGLTAVGVDVWARGRISAAGRAIDMAYRPLDVPAFGAAPLPPPRVVPTIPGPSVVHSEPTAPAPDRPAGARSDYGYDLDHGTPMGPDTHDVKTSY